jgi:hypothetical protein
MVGRLASKRKFLESGEDEKILESAGIPKNVDLD